MTAAATTAIAHDLRCEHAVDPLGIGVAVPVLSWRRGSHATVNGWRVLAATAPELLVPGNADLWDSGLLPPDVHSHLPWGGTPLGSRRRVWWTVLAAPNDCAAATATFETALLAADDWRAQWLGFPGGRPGRALYFRCAFELAGAVRQARLYATGLGLHVSYLNGQRLGDAVLDPAYTDVSRRVLYNTHDVGALLRPGTENVLAILAGNGWLPPPRVLAQLEIELADGTRQVVATGRRPHTWSWRVAAGPVGLNSLFDGEEFSADSTFDGWNAPGFQPIPAESAGGAWSMAHVMRPPGGRLVAQSLEPIRVVETLAPISVRSVAQNTWQFDFGCNHAGWIRLRAPGPVDLSLRHAEVLGSDGRIDQRNLRAARATDRLRLDAAGVWEPQFTYHGYRYVEIEGWPSDSPPGPQAVVSRVVRSALSHRARFACAERLLEDIRRMVLRTEESNLHGLPTDCPQRDERMGWLNDLTSRAEGLVIEFDAQRFLRKWLADLADAQDPRDGSLPDTVPHHWGNRPADPVCIAYPLIPWLLYVHHDDRRTLHEHRDCAHRWLDFLENQRRDGLVAYSHYGDWAQPASEALPGSLGTGAVSARTPGPLVSTGLYAHACRLFARCLDALGEVDRAAAFRARAADAAAALHRHYWIESAGAYGGAIQAPNALALALDLAPAAFRARAAASLVGTVRAAEGHLRTGNICTRFLLEALADTGAADLAYTVATRRTYPSWGYMLARGATTLWERWEERTGGGMNSHNHPMHGSIVPWLHGRLAGLRLDRDHHHRPTLVSRPVFPTELGGAESSLDTPWGEAAVAWERRGHRICGRLHVPIGLRAALHLPGVAPRTLEPGTHDFSHNAP